jgi:hypothetical protein
MYEKNLFFPSTLGLFATEDNPVDEQPEIRMEKPASASPSENTTFLVHSFVLYLTEKVSLAWFLTVCKVILSIK